MFGPSGVVADHSTRCILRKMDFAEQGVGGEHYERRPHSRCMTDYICSAMAMALIVGAIVEVVLIFDRLEPAMNTMSNIKDSVGNMTANGDCTSFSYRSSWRHLDLEDRSAFIDATRCLASRASHLHPSSSVYDDFAYMYLDKRAQSK